jgi:hypothetical protein
MGHKPPLLRHKHNFITLTIAILVAIGHGKLYHVTQYLRIFGLGNEPLDLTKSRTWLYVRTATTVAVTPIVSSMYQYNAV